MQILIRRLQAPAAISCSCFSTWVNSLGFPTATARVNLLASSTLLSCFSMARRESEIVDVAQDEQKFDYQKS
jgi:hypothetical protein